MKSYAKVLNQKLKSAGRDCVKSRRPEKITVLESTIREVSEMAACTGTFFPWTEAVNTLKLNMSQQVLLCALWGYSSQGCREMESSDFWQFYQELQDNFSETIKEIPVWIYENEGKVLVSPVLTGWLEGSQPILPKGARLYFPEKETAYGLEEIFSDAEKIFQAVEKRNRRAIFCVEGTKGSGRSFCMEQICAAYRMALLVLEGDVFEGSERQINACVLCAGLYGAFVCVKLDKEVRETLLSQLTDCFRFYGVIKDENREFTEHPEAVVYTRKLSCPDRGLKTSIVKEILGDRLEKLPETIQVSQLTGRHLPMGEFLRYIKNIRAELETGTIRTNQLLAVSRSRSLTLLPATRTFEELKLPAAQYEQLQKISKMIAVREEVLSGWGFEYKYTYGNGISVLFYGAPGTGKTMAAQVLANELGMPLYRVDLSQLISKYIGETQKNIGRIFDEAEKCDCILLFDEADAIFTKRSDVSDAQDRYSNAETAYLLQRIEQYAGVSILATNLLQNFDEAFRRRITYMVHFPMPDVKLRTELWETIFPEETPVSEEVDAHMLAQTFELSGASIKNAALHGALLARAGGSKVRMEHILDGIRNEYGKQGKSFNSSQKELLDAYR